MPDYPAIGPTKLDRLATSATAADMPCLAALRELSAYRQLRDHPIKRWRAQRWAQRFWDYHAEEISRHRNYLTVDERAWFDDLEGRFPRSESGSGRTSADATALQDLHRQLYDRAAQHRNTERAARAAAEAVQ